MFKLLSLFLILTITTPANSSDSECTDWVKKRGFSCIFAHQSADIYERECSNYCWWNSRTRTGNWNDSCNQQRVCHFDHPDTFNGKCSDWTEVRGTTCHNKKTGKWEQKWQRACKVGVKQSACSDSYPNQ